MVSGNNQTVAAGTELPANLIVLVADQYGNLIINATVTGAASPAVFTETAQ